VPNDGKIPNFIWVSKTTVPFAHQMWQ
jgi:hypothetical protein